MTLSQQDGGASALVRLLWKIALATPCVLLCARGVAQNPSEMPSAPTAATQVPLSGRQSGGGTVAVMQSTTNSGGGNTVNVMNSSVTAQAPYSGSRPTAKVTAGVLPLSLADALTMGLRENLGALSQSAAVQQALGARAVAKSTLLPQLNTVISEVFERENLRTFGVEVNTFPESVQYNYYDARAVRLTQSVFDLVRLRNLHSADETVQANLHAARNARDLIVLAVGGSYLQLIATQARMQATAAQVEISRAIYKQAADRLAAGLATRVDATRSQVQLQTEQQRLRSLQADFETQKLRLARIVGLALGQQFVPSEIFVYSPLTQFTIDNALPRAFSTRSDLQAAASGIKAAEAAVKAAHAEHLPTVSVTADFGAAGITPSHESTAVYNVAGSLSIPLYTGGRIHGESEQAAAALRQRQAEFDDLRGQVDQDVRQAFISLGSAADQVDVASSNVALAHETLTQSRDRFLAGIADTVEVVQAEQAAVQADDDYITAVFEHNLAKVSLARAMGDAEQTLPQLLRK